MCVADEFSSSLYQKRKQRRGVTETLGGKQGKRLSVVDPKVKLFKVLSEILLLKARGGFAILIANFKPRSGNGIFASSYILLLL